MSTSKHMSQVYHDDYYDTCTKYQTGIYRRDINTHVGTHLQYTCPPSLCSFRRVRKSDFRQSAPFVY